MRPWRLTRGQRVEIEAALSSFRARIVARPRRADPLRDAEDIEYAPLTAGWGQTVSVEPGRMFPSEKAVRVARARVAIALRAALRADEDARCEEVLGSVTWRLGHYHGARYAIDALRAWPRLRREGDRVPRALWERR